MLNYVVTGNVYGTILVNVHPGSCYMYLGLRWTYWCLTSQWWTTSVEKLTACKLSRYSASSFLPFIGEYFYRLILKRFLKEFWFCYFSSSGLRLEYNQHTASAQLFIPIKTLSCNAVTFSECCGVGDMGKKQSG